MFSGHSKVIKGLDWRMGGTLINIFSAEEQPGWEGEKIL